MKANNASLVSKFFFFLRKEREEKKGKHLALSNIQLARIDEYYYI
jgi:hypothetical protein